MSDKNNAGKVAPIIRDYETFPKDILDWNLIENIVETERNLPEVMDYDKTYREDYWARYSPENDDFQHLRYWWGLEKSRLREKYEEFDWPARVALKNDDTPKTESIAFAFVKCLTVRPELRDWLVKHSDLMARGFFDGSEEGIAAHVKYGDKAGLGDKYWNGHNLHFSYMGYLKLRYAPYIVPLAGPAKQDYDMISKAVSLYIYNNAPDAADDYDKLYEILKYLPADDYIIGTYFPENYSKLYGDKS